MVLIRDCFRVDDGFPERWSDSCHNPRLGTVCLIASAYVSANS
jgi:hypothetical protein